MAAAKVVYEGVKRTHGEGDTLFGGQKFWFSHNVPQRKWLMQNVEANGGIVVELEKQADVLLVDHTRKTLPPGSHSYKYVDASIRNGKLEDLKAHAVGESARSRRPVGSVTTAPKGGRTPFTAEDDQFLWNWVKPIEDAGGSTSGNLIYQHLEAANNRHTFQSWRDRWIKYVRLEERETTQNFHEGEDDEGPQPMSRESRRIANPGRPAPTVSRTPSALSPRRNPSPNPPLRMRQNLSPLSKDHSPDPPLQTTSNALPPPKNLSPNPPLQTTQNNLPPPQDPSHNLSVGASQNVVSPSNSLSSNHRNTTRDDSSPSKPKHEPPASSGITASERQDAKSWTQYELFLLFEAAEHILNCEEAHVDEAWQKMEENYSGHTAEEWKTCFESRVLPEYKKLKACRQRKNELKEGRETGEGEKQEVQSELEPNVPLTPRPNLDYADKGIQTSPLISPVSSRIHRSRRSPSFEPQSPTVSEMGNSTHGKPPEPNEARKRSTGRGTNSQDSNSTVAMALKSGDDVESMIGFTSIGKRPFDSANPLSPSPIDQPAAKRLRKNTIKLRDEPLNLEIASTPQRPVLHGDGDSDGDSDDDSDDDEDRDQSASPTPRPRHVNQIPVSASKRPRSPLFLPSPQDGESTTPKLKLERKTALELLTSPLSIRLVSEQDPPDKSSSFSQPRQNIEPDNGSPTPDFETAPEFSQLWETAPENHSTSRPNTQALFDLSVNELLDIDNFNLPEPDGGWDDSHSSANRKVATGPHSKGYQEEGSSSSSSLDAWVDAQLAKNPNIDEELLLYAAQTTNLDFRLAEQLYEFLVSGKGVPSNMKGVWTSDDDRALQGSDAREIKRVEEKHGKRGVEERWECLEKWR